MWNQTDIDSWIHTEEPLDAFLSKVTHQSINMLCIFNSQFGFFFFFNFKGQWEGEAEIIYLNVIHDALSISMLYIVPSEGPGRTSFLMIGCQ